MSLISNHYCVIAIFQWSKMKGFIVENENNVATNHDSKESQRCSLHLEIKVAQTPLPPEKSNNLKRGFFSSTLMPCNRIWMDFVVTKAHFLWLQRANKEETMDFLTCRFVRALFGRRFYQSIKEREPSMENFEWLFAWNIWRTLPIQKQQQQQQVVSSFCPLRHARYLGWIRVW